MALGLSSVRGSDGTEALLGMERPGVSQCGCGWGKLCFGWDLGAKAFPGPAPIG